jgi:crotonobetainyl-CoA:carnitine CoA-transferase CaiB-like acyl-CoA transferase
VRQPLEGLRVLELAEGVAGPYASKLFADLGADVVKLEPPGGDRSRRFSVVDAPGGMSSAFIHLNTNKRSMVADLTTPAGAELAVQLAGRSDLVIESLTDRPTRAPDVTVDALLSARPGLVVVSLSAFGHTGPNAHWRGEEIVTYAYAGPMASTGLRDREPVKMGAEVGQHHWGTIAALAALGAISVAERSGQSVHIDAAAIDAQFGSIDRRTTYLLYQVFTGMDAPRAVGPAISPFPTGAFPTADGYVQITTAPRWIPRMLTVLADDALAARYAAGDPLEDIDLPQAAYDAVLGWTLARSSQDAMEEAQASGWAVTALKTPAEVLVDRHLEARDFWVDVDLGAHGTIRQPGAPVRFHAGGWQLRRPAPALDAHRDEILAEVASMPAPTAPPRVDARLPLEGIVVVDITAAWAGPFATQLLSDLGATVIRLDNPAIFPTNTRGAISRPRAEQLPLFGPIFGGYPDLEPGERPWNRCAVYLAHARNKKSVTLDARTDLGREMLGRFIEAADVLVENNAVDLMDQLGIGWEAVHARNPRLVMVRLPSTGLDGPYRHYLGFGSNMEALLGLTAIRGYRDVDVGENDSVFHMDAATGGTAAFATLAALRRRERTGVGELVELAQAENLLNHIGDVLVDVARGNDDDIRMGNRHRWRAPQGVYRCVDAEEGSGGAGRVGAGGLDRWVAISVGDDEEWAGLQAAMEDPDWARDERFGTHAGRVAGHDEIDAGIAAWTKTLTHREAAARCQARGVPAGPVLTESEARADPHLRARGLLRTNHGRDIGTHEFAGHLFRWDGPPLQWEPIAALGDDNEAVYRGLLGVDDATWNALVDEGHISGVYRGADGRPL